MDRSEYVRIKLSDIPQDFIDEYDLSGADQYGWIYFEILRGCYGLPQSGDLQTTSYAPDLRKLTIMKPPHRRASGVISGVQSSLSY